MKLPLGVAQYQEADKLLFAQSELVTVGMDRCQTFLTANLYATEFLIYRIQG